MSKSSRSSLRDTFQESNTSGEAIVEAKGIVQAEANEVKDQEQEKTIEEAVMSLCKRKGPSPAGIRALKLCVEKAAQSSILQLLSLALNSFAVI